MIKRLLFAPIYTLSLFAAFYIGSVVLSDSKLVFDFSINSISQFLVLTGIVTLSGIFLAIFVTLANDWVLIVPVTVISSLVPLWLMPNLAGLLLALALLIAQILSVLYLKLHLRVYINFDAISLLMPGVKLFVWWLILIMSLMYYFKVSDQIKNQGFELPDSLIETALKFTPMPNIGSSAGDSLKISPELINSVIKSTGAIPQTIPTPVPMTIKSPAPSANNSQSASISSPTPAPTTTTLPPGISLTPEQKELLKQNPEILKQYGIDPKVLDVLGVSSETNPKVIAQLPATNLIPQSTTNSLIDIIKPTIKKQFQQMLDPYLPYIPIILAGLIYFILSSFSAITTLIGSGVLWLMFWIFIKTGLVKITSTMIESKRLSV